MIPVFGSRDVIMQLAYIYWAIRKENVPQKIVWNQMVDWMNNRTYFFYSPHPYDGCGFQKNDPSHWFYKNVESLRVDGYLSSPGEVLELTSVGKMLSSVRCLPPELADVISAEFIETA